MEQKIYSTYKFYTEKGDRMAIFAKEEDGVLKIVQFKCSRKDQFYKSKAREAFNCYNEGRPSSFHPQRFNFPIPENVTAGDWFFAYCNDNYFRLGMKRVVYLETTLFNRRGVKHIKKSSKIFNKTLW